MKLKITITVGISISIILAIIIAICLYFYTGNITSKVPTYMKEECKVTEEKYQNRSVFIIKPKEKQNNNKVIYYLHGGSYVAELSQAHWKFLSKLAQDTGSTLVVPDYPLTPQYRYTDTFNMVEPLYHEIASKVETESLILMGDSAGGGMALALAEKIGQEGATKPSKTILISPWLDVSLENEKIKEVQEKDKMLNSELLKLAGIAYSGSEEKTKEYLVSPIYGPLENLENVVIYIGTNDILNPDVHTLEQKAMEKRCKHNSKRNGRCCS